MLSDSWHDFWTRMSHGIFRTGGKSGRLVAAVSVALLMLPGLSFGAPSAAADTCFINLTPEEIIEKVRNSIPTSTRGSHLDCLGGLQDCDSAGASATIVNAEVHLCSLLLWLEDQANLAPAYEAYEEQFPGCVPPGCQLRVDAYSMQVRPDDPTAPSYKGGSAPVCTRDNMCSVAEYGQAALHGWNGTMSIQCLPGTESTSFFFAVTCVRNGFSVGPASSAQALPAIATLYVPFGQCVEGVTFEQTAIATLILGPLGETYNLPPKTKESNPLRVCNSIRTGSN